MPVAPASIAAKYEMGASAVVEWEGTLTGSLVALAIAPTSALASTGARIPATSPFPIEPRRARSRRRGSSVSAVTEAAKVRPPDASRAWCPMSSRDVAIGSTCCSLRRPWMRLCCASRRTVSVIKTLGTALIVCPVLRGLMRSVGLALLDELVSGRRIVEGEDGHRQVGGVLRARITDGDGRNRDAGRHLGHREQRVQPTEGTARHGHADHG